MSERPVPVLPRLPLLPASDASVHDKCSRCGGHCCTYFALQIDTPRTWDDYDDIRWYVAHHGVQVYKEGRRWYLHVAMRCTHLTGGGLCGIYERRPRICRDHSVESCEFENDEPFDFSVHFQSSADVDAFMARRWPRGRPKRKVKARRRALPKRLRLR